MRQQAEAGDADAAVMDAPIARYWMEQNQGTDLSISPHLDRFSVALIVPEEGGAAGNTYVRQLITAILEATERPAYAAGYVKWFPRAERKHMSDEPLRWDLMIPTLMLIGLYALLQLFLICRKAKLRPCSPLGHAVAPAAGVDTRYRDHSRDDNDHREK